MLKANLSNRSPGDFAPIAVLGYACRLPQAATIDEYWRMLVEGRSAIEPLPEHALNARLYYSPSRNTLTPKNSLSTYTNLGALVPRSSPIRPSLRFWVATCRTSTVRT